MKEKKLFIITPLNTMGFSYARETDKEWLLARCKIMQKYTAQSLANQTNKEFNWHILVREETKFFIRQNFDNPEIYYNIVTPEESDIILDSAVDYCDDLLLIRLNSDDCYHKNFIQIVKDFDYADDKQALIFQNGYMWYQKEDIIIKRNFPSPPFYAYIYDSKEYKEGFRYDVPGHNHIRFQLRTHALREDLWLWLINEWNNKILRGSSYPDPAEFPKAEKWILGDFGL